MPLSCVRSAHATSYYRCSARRSCNSIDRVPPKGIVNVRFIVLICLLSTRFLSFHVFDYYRMLIRVLIEFSWNCYQQGVILDNDTLLADIAFSETQEVTQVGAIDHAIILAMCLDVKNHNPKDGLVVIFFRWKLEPTFDCALWHHSMFSIA
jgi:hypothetical protein